MYTKKITSVSNMGYFRFLRKKLDMGLVRALLKSEALSVTEASKRIGTSKIRASVALRELMEEGIVKREIVGRTHRYSFNYCHRNAGDVLRLVLAEKAQELRDRLNAEFVFEFIKSILGENMTGVIFFGSCVSGPAKFGDVDVFLLFGDGKKEEQEERVNGIFGELGLVLPGFKFSFMLGTENEVEDGYIMGKDAFYGNLVNNGLPFGCEEFFIGLRLRKCAADDSRERFILGVREIISCRKHEDDPVFLERHLEKGIFDVAYAVLNRFGQYPADDYEVMSRMKELFGTKMPEKGKANVERGLEFARMMSSKMF